jgi:hypothetical protein
MYSYHEFQDTHLPECAQFPGDVVDSVGNRLGNDAERLFHVLH